MSINQALQKVFNLFDRDQDGSITVEDVQDVMNSLSFLKNEIEMPSIDQIRESFRKFDENSKSSRFLFFLLSKKRKIKMFLLFSFS